MGHATFKWHGSAASLGEEDVEDDGFVVVGAAKRSRGGAVRAAARGDTRSQAVARIAAKPRQQVEE